MVRFENVRERKYNTDATQSCVADLQVSTVSELPTMNVAVGGIYVLPGSIAQIIQENEPTFLTMDANGSWYPAQS